uniref:Uncharacterized protein n=1 Tax=Pelodiscus sinensis TaxID=13735 RepID=K7G930_PELSI
MLPAHQAPVLPGHPAAPSAAAQRRLREVPRAAGAPAGPRPLLHPAPGQELEPAPLLPRMSQDMIALRLAQEKALKRQLEEEQKLKQPASQPRPAHVLAPLPAEEPMDFREERPEVETPTIFISVQEEEEGSGGDGSLLDSSAEGPPPAKGSRRARRREPVAPRTKRPRASQRTSHRLSQRPAAPSPAGPSRPASRRSSQRPERGRSRSRKRRADGAVLACGRGLQGKETRGG